MANEKKNGAIKWLLIIAAVLLLVFICWKAGWILTGEKNEVSEQEKQEAIQEAVQEVNATMETEFQEAKENLQEAADEIRDALKD